MTGRRRRCFYLLILINRKERKDRKGMITIKQLTVNVRLTQRQRDNAVAFLKRVPLKGEEAQALVEVINALSNPRDVKDLKDQRDEKTLQTENAK